MTDMSPRDKPLVWLKGQVRTPPLSAEARIEAGFLLRRLQRGEVLGLPASRPMPSVGSGCHELRILDVGLNWRLMYYVATDAIVVLDVFAKKTPTTPKAVIDECRKRLRMYLKITSAKKGARNAR
jgi:phage-related protein